MVGTTATSSTERMSPMAKTGKKVEVKPGQSKSGKTDGGVKYEVKSGKPKKK